ncbi:MAG: hypothetical protein GY847_21810 [Proteobacteria bacterium]|nr:hypothetical protein [Pseudomonadota bacterium]
MKRRRVFFGFALFIVMLWAGVFWGTKSDSSVAAKIETLPTTVLPHKRPRSVSGRRTGRMSAPKDLGVNDPMAVAQPLKGPPRSAAWQGQGVPKDPNAILNDVGLLPFPETSDLPEQYKGTSVEYYLDATRYPKSQGLLTSEHSSLLEPARRYEKPRRVNSKDRNSPEFILRGDRYALIGQDKANVAFRAWDTAGPVPSEIITALIQPQQLNRPIGHTSRGETPPEPQRQPDPVYVTFTEAGDTHNLTIEPAAYFPTHDGPFRLLVEFKAAGEPGRASLDFTYTPSKRIPAHFTGKFKDELRDGSLVVTVGFDVKEAGRFIIDANLFNEDSKPLVWTRFKGDLKEDAEEFELIFYGKAFHDAHAQGIKAYGSFTVANLRGKRVVMDGINTDQNLAPYEGTYETDNFELAGFTQEVHDSSHKRETLAGMVRDMEKGGFPTAAQ